jgi:cystathionine beta-lyase/cystathionine gamma-synthase
VVSFLKQHAAVSRVLFPSGKLARSQMSKSGSLLAFNLSLEPMAFLKKLNLIKIAHSFGGVETVIQQPTQMMDLSFSSQHLKKFLIDDSFFRLSIGLEDPADIIEDVQQALE